MNESHTTTEHSGTRSDSDSIRPLDPRVAQTRRIVTQAAAELLAEEGFERLSIEGIAERSGVARSTIYRNWSDRSALLADAFDHMCAFPDIPDLGSMADELRFLAQAVAEALTTADWAKALPSLVGASHHDPGLAEAKMRFSEQRRRQTGAIFERAMTRGEIASGRDPQQLAEFFAAPLFFRFLMSHQPLDEAFVERHVAMVLAMATNQ